MTSKKYKVAWVANNQQAQELRDKLELNLRIQLVDNLKESDLKEAVLKDSITVGIVLSEKFDSALTQQKKAGIKLYFEGQSRGLAMVEKAISNYRKSIIQENTSELNLPEGLLTPLEITENDLTDTQALIDNAIKILYNSISVLTILLLLFFGFAAVGFSLYRNGSDLSGFTLKVTAGTVFAFLMMGLSVLGLYFALVIKQEGIFENIMMQLRSVVTFDKLLLIIISSIPLGLFFYGIRAIIYYHLKKPLRSIAGNTVLILLLFLSVYVGISSDTLNYYNVFLPYANNVYAIKSILSDNYTSTLLVVNGIVTIATALLLILLSYSGFKKNRITN